MKKLLTFIFLAITAANVYADAAEDALLSAQSAYRAALNTQSTTNTKIITLQTNLADAQSRAQKAQADISRLQNEIQVTSASKSQQESILQQAGEKLNAAWQAVYGPGGTKTK